MTAAQARTRGPINTWLAVGTPLTAPYPCRCNPEHPCNRLCPCHGRTTGDDLPPGCCARTPNQTPGPVATNRPGV